MPTPFSDLKRQLIPDDDTGQVLRQMLDDGIDLEQPRDLDFFVVFAERAKADAFAAAAGVQEDAEVHGPEIDEEGIWQVAVTRRMVPTHAAVTAFELEIAELAERHGGYPDGWGSGDGDDDDTGDEG